MRLPSHDCICLYFILPAGMHEYEPAVLIHVSYCGQLCWLTWHSSISAGENAFIYKDQIFQFDGELYEQITVSAMNYHWAGTPTKKHFCVPCSLKWNWTKKFWMMETCWTRLPVAQKLFLFFGNFWWIFYNFRIWKYYCWILIMIYFMFSKIWNDNRSCIYIIKRKCLIFWYKSTSLLVFWVVSIVRRRARHGRARDHGTAPAIQQERRLGTSQLFSHDWHSSRFNLMVYVIHIKIKLTSHHLQNKNWINEPVVSNKHDWFQRCLLCG